MKQPNFSRYRTKDGKWVTRTQEIQSGNEFDEANEVSEEEAESSSDDDDEEVKKPISVVDILAKRRVLLTEAKVQVNTSILFHNVASEKVFPAKILN